MWRRANVVTDLEFIELRYTGRPAAILRGFLAVYHGVLINCIIMGWVMLAMTKICDVALGWPKLVSLAVLVLIALVYTVLSGFWGVVMTDLIQFIMAMTGSIALALIVVWKLGGPADMVEAVSAAPDFSPKVLAFVPDLKTAGKLAVITFAIQLSLQWWPKGQGDGYLAQRLFATKNERHAALASLWFNFANYVLRPWPWIVVGLASFVYFSNADLAALNDGTVDHERAYPLMIMKFLPSGLRGLMVASLLAAFMSTIDTHLNWGASYLVNDLYKRFVRPEAEATHYVLVSRILIVALMICAALVTWQLKSIEGAWKYHVVLLSGSGLVILLRWFWWRINPWSEISAFTTALVLANGNWIALGLSKVGLLGEPQLEQVQWLYSGDAYAIRLAIIMGVCTVVWIAVTLLTRPVKRDHLEAFYARVQPGGWWGDISRTVRHTAESSPKLWLAWLMGVCCIYSGLFGIGYCCLARYGAGAGLLAISVLAGWGAIRSIPDTPKA